MERTPPAEQPPAPSASASAKTPAAVRERLEAALATSKSSATRRAYAAAWRAWLAYCERSGSASMPANPEAFAAHLAERAGEVGLPSLRLAVAAVGMAHEAAGHPNPCKSPLARLAMAGFAKQSSAAPKQAAALGAEAVAAIRGHLNGQADNSSRAARDIALAQTISDAGLRRSEAAALRWRDLEVMPDGTGRLAIRRSKTDQAGEGEIVAVTRRAVADLRRLARARGFGGHSGRVECAVRMTRAGAPPQAIMRQERWKSVEMIGRYTKNESAAEALRYLE